MYWKIRKGYFPAVGAVRESGTTVIIEDVAYPIECLSEATLELQDLFKNMVTMKHLFLVMHLRETSTLYLLKIFLIERS